MQLIRVTIVLALVYTGVEGQKRPPGANYPYLATLCKLYLTETHHPIPAPREIPGTGISPEVEAIMVAMAEPDWYAALEAGKEKTEIPEPLQKKYEKYMSDWDIWKDGQAQLGKMDNVTRLDGSSPAVEKGRIKILKIVKRLKSMREAIRIFSGDERRQKITKKIKKAVTGVDSDKPTDVASVLKALGAKRSTACGVGASDVAQRTAGEKAGEAIVVDMLCVCAAGSTTSGSQKDFCGAGIGGSGSGDANNKWGESTSPPNEKLLKTITDVCTAQSTPPPKNARELKNALASFIQAAHKGADCEITSSNNVATVPNALGFWHVASCTLAAEVLCSGDASTTGGPCIFYKASSDKKISVPWYTELSGILDDLENLENEERQIANNQAFREALETRAYEIYEEAKENLELQKGSSTSYSQNQDQKQNPTSASDRSAAQDPSAVSTASITRFILPWTLLI